MKLLRRGAVGVCTVALFAVAMWLTDAKTHVDGKLQNPLITKGRIGTVISNGVFSVKVTRVDVASALLKHDVITGDQRRPTPGVFVIIHLDVQSDREPLTLGHVRLVTPDGPTYDESGRPEILSDYKALQPMLWRQTYYVFEIPKDKLAGAQLIVGQSDIVNNLSAETQVDLRIDRQAAARMLAHPTADYVLKTS